eukprot:gene3855-4813_t
MVSCTNDADAPDGFVCGACPVGFTDEHTGRDGTKCEDVDGCLDQPCAREKECFDVLGQDVAALGASHTCGPCPAGYLAVGELCEDVDECALANGGCWMTSDGSVKALCVNEPGGFSCGGCPAGLRGSGLTGCEPTTDCRENNGGCWVGTGADTGFAADCEQTEGLDDEACVNELGMRFWWSAAASDGSVVALDAATNKADTLSLSLPKASLVVDFTYTFQLSAALVGNPLVAASVKSSFFVQSQPLVLVIRGGEVATGESSPITLDASESVDPDGEEREIAFTWRCYIAGGGDCRLADGTLLPTITTGANLSMRLTGGLPAINYTFALTGTKGARTNEAHTRVNITRGSPPVPLIIPLLGKANPGEKLRLQSSVAAVDTAQLRYEWTVLAEEGTHKLDLEAALASSSRFQASLVLQPRVLAPGGEYTFQLAAEDSIGLGAVRVNAPPAGGYVDATPSVGQAYADIFSLSAPGWKDEDAPLWYQYSFRVVSLGASVIALSSYAPLPGPEYAIATMIPGEGLEEEGYTVTVVGAIQDSLGATTHGERNLTVRPPSTDDAAALTGSLVSGAADALKNGDVDGAAVQIDGAAALLNAEAAVAAEAEVRNASAATRETSQWRRQMLGDLNATAARSALRAEMLESVQTVRSVLFPTAPTVERLAQSAKSLTAVPAELSPETQDKSMTLLTALVGDTLADPVGAPLTEAGAQAVCSGLAALNQAADASEGDGESDRDSGAAAAGNHTLAESRAREVADAMGLMAQSMLDGFMPGEPGPEVVADGLAMKVERSEASDPDSTLYAVPLATAGTTVAFPAALASILSATSSGRRRRRLAAACNRTAGGDDEVAGCFQTAQTVAVDTRLLVSAVDPYTVAPDPRAAVTSGVTTIEMRASGGDEVKIVGLSEALVFSIELNPASEGAPAGGGVGGGSRVRCAYWNVTRGEYASDGCTQMPNPVPAGADVYWKTRVIFSGPRCMLSEVQQCYCTHLTDFKAVQDMDVVSVEPPKVKTLNTKQMASLSAK